MLTILLLTLEAQAGLEVQAKLAVRQRTFAAPEKNVVLPTITLILSASLVQILIILLALLALEVSFVSGSLGGRVEDLELHLVDVAWGGFVEPSLETLLVLAELVYGLLGGDQKFLFWIIVDLVFVRKSAATA